MVEARAQILNGSTGERYSIEVEHVALLGGHFASADSAFCALFNGGIVARVMQGEDLFYVVGVNPDACCAMA